MDSTNSGTELTEQFYREHLACETLVQRIRDKVIPQDKLEDVKQILRKLESILEELEKESTIPAKDMRLKQARAKGCRHKYQEIVKKVMREDSQTFHEDGIGFRRTSDLIFDDLDYTGSIRNTIIEQDAMESLTLTEDFEEDPAAVEILEWNVDLEKGILIGSACVFCFCMAAYFFVKYYL